MEVKDLIKKIRILESNKIYRIGDLVYCRGPKRWLKDRIMILSDNKYKNTILYNYLNEIDINEDARNTNEGVHWDKLINSIKKFYSREFKSSESEKKEINELFINIRSGDIVTDNQWHKSCYLFNHDKLVKKVDKYYCDKIKKITIFTAMHYGSDEIDNRFFFNSENYNLNVKFLSSIFKKLYNRFKCQIDVYSSNSKNIKFIDESFAKLIFSKACIVDHGGFAKLISEVRLRTSSHT
ncbi:hypothetical protein N9H45_07040 [Opitutales bacterium]|nr:hypothetical protein [Opitutales bacterium]